MKKILLVIVAALSCVLLFACSSGNATSSAAPEESSESASSEALGPEYTGDAETVRTYTVENMLDETVTEFYCYRTDGGSATENLAEGGIAPGDTFEITVEGYMLGTPNETLWTVEYVTESGESHKHTTLHVEDELLGKVLGIVGENGGDSSATFFSFDTWNLPAEEAAAA